MFKFTATVLAAMAFCGAAQAQGAYPNKPIRLLVPFAAGGTTDLIARVIAEPLSRELGQPVFAVRGQGCQGRRQDLGELEGQQGRDPHG